MILDFEKFIQGYLFVNNDTESGDVYYCDCGEIFTKNSADSDLKQQLIDTKSSIDNLDSDEDLMSEFQSIYKGVKLGTEEEVRCPGCAKNFQDYFNKENFISNQSPFISGFCYKELEDSIILFYSVIRANLISTKSKDFSEDVKLIRFEKESRKIFFKDYKAEEIEIDLDEVMSTVNKFFFLETPKVINLMDMHLFVGRISNFIIDAKNINIIHDLLGDLHGKMFESGLEVIKKITSIFLGIIKYSNLSTVAMTKSSVFLYDLMKECDIPKPEVFIESNATSPIKIFNFLTQNYIKKLNQEVNADNKDVHEFTYKSKTRITYDDDGENVEVKDLADEEVIKINVAKLDYGKSKVKKVNGQFQVEDAILDGNVSKFIYNKIRNFSDYKKIIKFLKFVDKQELILLLQRYDIDFLLNVIDLIYFRNKLPFKALERFFSIIIDATTIKSKHYSNMSEVEFKINYAYVKDFNFIMYDDTLMMMEVLKFDPKIHFNKIKTWDELDKYHDNLVKYFSVLKDEEKNGSIMDFVSKFKFLEEKSEDGYNGPLDIILLSTPGMIIKEGIEMKHSASAYARNVAQGLYLMAQVYDRDPLRTNSEPPRYTIGFTYDKLAGLEFDQVKGYANEGKPGVPSEEDGIPKKTDRFKLLMMEWLTTKDISYRPINDLKLTSNIDGNQEMS